MYLEKLDIQGFKSFALKTTLEFGKGITAIVGPNGSGKSNIADAVRWVLGEQSLKTIRGKRSEDVIFAGSDKKTKLGVAEASLYLNNEDRSAPIDFSELVITRRVYRDGTGEYLVNKRPVRLQVRHEEAHRHGAMLHLRPVIRRYAVLLEPGVHAVQEVRRGHVAALQHGDFPLVHPHGAAGLLLQTSGQPQVVRMRVRQQQRLDLRNAGAAILQLLRQRRHRIVGVPAAVHQQRLSLADNEVR